ncbi:SsgA family sporulation/cell division regulator [Streptomyces sp. SKN60]|uniref:SsgA family sporulation/cell division regulator n=1 Tax=Streptomyces sp. SKN60 TaxID=2855506 RepID=UPI0022472382|nr:SsgA family sporulation/cell division regulator [Streptomyces sp. SKN60]MCX2180370.1 SsgA family sporulation/cell division regulator [Streptomyces sp. SKN60]
MSKVIEQAVQARLVASAPRTESVAATLRYDRADPYAVSMAFPPPATLEGVEVSWAFARELLVQGVDGPAGVGDVRLRPYGYDRTVVEFHAPEGVAMVHIRTSELRSFLERSQHVVPSGREHQYVDWDQDLAQLLEEHP